jgi:uncharacterized protein (DUF2225 family)
MMTARLKLPELEGHKRNPNMYLANVGVKCPGCGVKFNSKQLPLYLETGKRDSELRQEIAEKNLQLEQYTICTCPTCGLSDWMKAFPATKEKTLLQQANITPHLQFRNAAMACERNGRGSYKAGLFFLYAAWCADDAKAYLQAAEYRKAAATAFMRSLTDGTCPNARKSEIEYLIGELLRRFGEFASSQEYFRSVINQLPAKFAFMARRLMRRAELKNSEPISFQMQVS